mmetsp:Transcript_16565/g.46322  ORF Transcript_16565/g.46322 Transcript_16565/m.46322 type:complete len:255 (-) Transcript_16565:185-949(-)
MKSCHSSRGGVATYGCVSYIGRSPNPPLGSAIAASASVWYGTTNTFPMAKSIFSKFAPIKASLQARRGPATMIMCCLAPACNSPTLALCVCPSLDMVISNGNDASSDSRCFIPFLTSFIFFFCSSRSSTLPVNSPCLSRSNLNKNANNATAPKSIPRFRSSVFKLKSGLAELAMAPDPLTSPPRNAPEPKAPYKNNRSVRHGAIDSVSSLLRMFVSTPPLALRFALLSFASSAASSLVVNGGDDVGASCCACCP